MMRSVPSNVSPVQSRQFDHPSGLERYTRVEKVGIGAYGAVYKCHDNESKSFVALKKIKMEVDDSGIPPTAMREIALLRQLTHPNVVFLQRVLVVDYRLYLVFEYLEVDLKRHMDSTGPFTIDMIRSYSAQILEGLAYCHCKGVMHRDLKPQNLLVSNGCVKLADFGLARSIAAAPRRLTTEVVTRWYRPPELLLGQQEYTMSVDIWSVGCIIAEMYTKQALFPGKNELEQIHFIFHYMGTPTFESWPSVRELPLWRPNFPEWAPKDLRSCFSMIDAGGASLIQKTLQMDPTRRISAIHALRDPFVADFVRDVAQFPISPSRFSSPKHASSSRTGLEAMLGRNEEQDSIGTASENGVATVTPETIPTVSMEFSSSEIKGDAVAKSSDSHQFSTVKPRTLSEVDVPTEATAGQDQLELSAKVAIADVSIVPTRGRGRNSRPVSIVSVDPIPDNSANFEQEDSVVGKRTRSTSDRSAPLVANPKSRRK